MTLAIDHEEVRQSEDRTWTLRLLDVVRSRSVSDAERDDAFQTLAHLEDPRSVVPLTEIVEDPSLREAVREAASRVLGGFDDCTTGERRRGWWGSGDPVMMAHALRLMERSESDVVIPVAGDDAHPLQRHALLALTWGFDEPQFQAVKIRALGHPAADVRRTAADVLMWDEPVAAERALLDAAADASTEVATAAIDTLQYYPSRRVLRALADLVATAERDEVRAKAAESLDYNRGRFEYVATHGNEKQFAVLRKWMEPVEDIVTWSKASQDPDHTSPRTGVSRLAVSESELLALIADADGEWAPKKRRLQHVDWDKFTAAERGRLCEALTTHGDPGVRALATVPLAAWSRTRELLGLSADPCFSVRKSAMYSLGLVPKDETLAAAAWEYMLAAAGTTAHEALQTYAAHASPAQARKRLVELARTDRRESVRTTAISCLVKLDAVAELETLAPLLGDPPGVTWAVHIGIIDGLRALSLPVPDLDHLAAIDNLDLVESVVALRCSLDR